MSWTGIGHYLSRFRQFHPPEDTVQIRCAEVLSRALGVIISSENISIKNHCLYVQKIDSVTKGEVYLKKESLLRLIRTELGSGVVTNIK